MKDRKVLNKDNSPLLKISDLGVQIEGVQLLSNISLEINQAEVLALIGPNGSGKTTLLKTIAAEQNLNSGSVSFEGQLIKDWKPRELAQRLAVLPQKSVLNFPFTGREVVTLGRTPHEAGQIVDQEIVDEVLEYLDAGYLADRPYPRLSGGEQQRIQLARVLAQIWVPKPPNGDQKSAPEIYQPRLLLLDEPSSYFDLAHQQILVQLVRHLATRNIAVLIVLHDINLALACADRIAVMSCGQLAACGSADEVITPALVRQIFSVDASFIRDPETGQQILGLKGGANAKFGKR